MTDVLEQLQSQLSNQPDLPPLDQWEPALSGDIDIEIRRNGEWWHEGSPIRRQPLVKLFASILRREKDGEYYLVTPVEKWRLRVEDRPLLVVDFDVDHPLTPEQRVIVTTNVGRHYELGETYPLWLDDAGGEEEGENAIPLVSLDHGLEARFDRPAYYRLVEIGEVEGEQMVVRSGGRAFTIGYLNPAPETG